MSNRVRALADSDASCGGKAVGLAQLVRAGLPVPDGFVLDSRAFRALAGELTAGDDDLGHVLAAAADRLASAAIEPALDREVRDRAAALGVLAVRSSATLEDGGAGAAAGVFASRTAVAPEAVWDAIRAVWLSALTPLAAGYARHRHAELAVGVIVQRFVAGARATIYTRPPGSPRGSDAVIQRGDVLERRSREDQDDMETRSVERRSREDQDDTETRGVERRSREDQDDTETRGLERRSREDQDDTETRSVERLPRDASDRALALALRAEAAIGAEATGADVELVGDWVVQARPIIHVAPRTRVPPPELVLAALRDGRIWRWDIAHNPDPLSIAQAGLVERVDRAGGAPWSLRVCAGFLYAARRLAPPPVIAVDDLAARAAALEARLGAALGDAAAPSLTVALARYAAFYRIWAGELAPLVAAARAGVAAPGSRPSAIEATLLAAARDELTEAAVIDRLGMLAPAWDVAVPTFGERPELLRDAIARARGVASNAPAPATHDLAADLAERDDAWFSRAQHLVRRALLARGAELGIGDDVFWIPLDDVLGDQVDRDDVSRRASAARAAAKRAARWDMPVVVGGEPPPTGVALRGVGSGPRVSGRVVRFASLATAVAASTGDIVVTRAVTPALAVLVIGCAAIVSETGGLLDHGAALARELGIPCVVGCHAAWTTLVDGQRVTVDGDRGTVELVTS